jgi:hypothetical protein
VSFIKFWSKCCLLLIGLCVLEMHLCDWGRKDRHII